MNRLVAIPIWRKRNDPCVFMFESDTSKAKQVEILPFDQFLRKVTSMKEKRTYNEFIWKDKPCKIFLDCELKGTGPKPDLIEYVAALHEEVNKCFRGIRLNPPMFATDMRPNKFSVHVIYDGVVASTTDPIAALVNYLGQRDIMGVGIDVGVVPDDPDIPRTLRMPYCFKGHDPTSGAMLPYGAPVGSFDLPTFCRFLLTFHAGHSKQGAPIAPLPERLITLDDLIPEVALCLPNKRARLSTVVDFDNTSPPPRGLDLLPLLVPDLEIRNFKYLVKGGGWRFRTTVYCAVAQRWHESNEQYFNGKEDGEILIGCTDSDSCKLPIEFEYTQHELRVSKEPWKIDWGIIDNIVKKH